MGEHDQRRLIRKLDLERLISRVKPHPSPSANLEQYTLSESAAATVLYFAAYSNGDIVDKRILDLGCGTGRLGLGAAFLGAKQVVGVDIDKQAVRVAVENSKMTDLSQVASWVAGDIDAVTGVFDTVLQNPPFGVQKRSADRRFLEKALELGCTVYSLHNHPSFDKILMEKLESRDQQLMQVEPNPFVKQYTEKLGGRVVGTYALPLSIPRMFEFHTKTKRKIIVDLYIIKNMRQNFRL